MNFATVQKPGVLLVAIAAASVLCAGCIAQDRPEAESFLVVADAGPHQVVAGGSTAHFQWSHNQSVRGEGGHAPPAVEPHYLWTTDAPPGVLSTNESFSLTGQAPSFALVSLTVSVEKSSASDVAGVLFVPGPTSSERRVYIAAVGDIGIESGTPEAAVEHHLGPFKAQETQRSLGGPSEHLRFSITQVGNFLGTPVEGSLVIAVKDGSGLARAAVTPPMTFEGNASYTLVIDPRPGANHEVEIARPGSPNQTVTLSEFVHAHEAKLEVETLVTHSQTLPGFQAATAFVSVVAAAVAAALGRQRAPLRRRP